MQKKLEESCEIVKNGAEAVLGRLAFSLAGRDSGKYFIAVGVYDENHILLADGDFHKLEKPKKKKLRHIRLMRISFPDIKEKLRTGKPILNAELRKAIAAYKENTVNADSKCGYEP